MKVADRNGISVAERAGGRKSRQTTPTTEPAPCPLCGDGVESTFLFDAPDRIFGISERNFRYVSCDGCGLVRLDPRPTPGFMGLYYEGTDRLIREGGGKSARRRPLINLIERFFRGARARDIAGRTALRKGDRVLDIGSGPGSFLRYFSHASGGAFLLGLDNSADACRWASTVHGQRSICGDATLTPFKAGAFRLVTLWHFLEHSYDPAATLKECARLIGEDGLLAVEVPSYDGPCVRRERGRWFGLMTPLHLYQFTPATLSRLLGDAGFEVAGLKQRIFIPNLLAGFLLRRPSKPRGSRGMMLLAPLFLFSMLIEWPAAVLAALFGRGYVTTIYARPRRMESGP